MKSRGLQYLPLLLFLLVLGSPLSALAQARNIYVGDIVTLRIAGPGLSAEVLGEKFRDFEIVEIQAEQGETAESGGYQLSLRTLTAGEHRIALGDKEIVVKVQSTLDEMQGRELFAGEPRLEQPDFPAQRVLLVVLGIALGGLALAGAFFLWRGRPKNVPAPPDPYQVFLRRTGELAPEADDYFVSLTLYFKEYLEAVQQIRIIGKTSTEIVAELQGLEDLAPYLPEIGAWLTVCDRYKFAGTQVALADKREHGQKLFELVASLEKREEPA